MIHNNQGVNPSLPAQRLTIVIGSVLTVALGVLATLGFFHLVHGLNAIGSYALTGAGALSLFATAAVVLYLRSRTDATTPGREDSSHSTESQLLVENPPSPVKLKWDKTPLPFKLPKDLWIKILDEIGDGRHPGRITTVSKGFQRATEAYYESKCRKEWHEESKSKPEDKSWSELYSEHSVYAIGAAAKQGKFKRSATESGMFDLVQNFSTQVSGSTLCFIDDVSEIHLYDVEKKKYTHTLTRGIGFVMKSCLIAHDRVIAGHNDHSIQLWDLKTGQASLPLIGHTASIHSLAVAGSKLFSHDIDGTIKIWDMPSGHILHTIQTDEAVVDINLGITRCDHNLTVVGNTLILHDFQSISTYDIEKGLLLHSWAVDPFCTILDVSDKEIISLHNNGKICVWDTSTSQLLRSFGNNLEADILNMVCIVDQRIIMHHAKQRKIEVWNKEGKLLNTLSSDRLWQKIKIAGNKMCASTLCNTLEIWDIEQEKLLHTFYKHQLYFYGLHIHGDVVIAGCNEGIKIFGLDTGKCLRTLGTSGEITQLEVIDNTIVGIINQAKMEIWEIERK